MNFAVNVGNSNIALGVYRNGDWLRKWRIQSIPDRMPDEYAFTIRGLFSDIEIVPGDVDKVILSSVVPTLTDTFTTCLAGLFSGEPLILGSDVRLPIKFEVGNPREVGADLIANASAAYARYRASCIVVDFGTALTFTPVNAQGAFLGAAIAPGLKIASDALTRQTAQLPNVRFELPKSAIGTNTVHAIQAGMVLGYTGLVEKVLAEMIREMGESPSVVATGGLSPVMGPRCAGIHHVDEWLTLDGLRVVLDMNL